MNKRKQVIPFIENVGEATAACLITMVQGNLLILGLGHWVIASQTGLAAGVLATVLLGLAKTSNRIAISIILGVVTAIVDYFIHEGMFGPEAAEAMVTGLGAAILSFAISTIAHHYSALKQWVASGI